MKVQKKVQKKAKYDEETGLPYLPEDLSMRLGRSLVRYDDRPVYIIDTGVRARGYYLSTHDVLNNTDLVIDLPCELLDVRPVPLGYVNLNQALYVSRRPHRKYKQGLCAEALNIEGRVHVDKRALITSKALANCIMNIYPTFEEALEVVKVKKSSCAFSRKFALCMDKSGVVFLEYRGEKVGSFSGSVELGESHSYLKEELEAVHAYS